MIHTGDFKIDCTPMKEEVIDLGRFAELGQEGVLALLADSTNAERPGYTPSERKISASFDILFNQARDKRIIIATFASNISRVQQIINCAVKYGRKVALSGRSMLNVMGIASELGYLDVPEGVLIDIDMLNRYPREKVVLITTGSQGEPMSALSRMAFADHRKVEVGPGDCIILSARPIPGNEKTVGNVINELLKRGCEVVSDSSLQVHVSGHASQEELKIIQSITKPQVFSADTRRTGTLAEARRTGAGYGNEHVQYFHWHQRRRRRTEPGFYEAASICAIRPDFGGWLGRRRCGKYCAA